MSTNSKVHLCAECGWRQTFSLPYEKTGSLPYCSTCSGAGNVLSPVYGAAVETGSGGKTKQTNGKKRRKHHRFDINLIALVLIFIVWIFLLFIFISE